MDSSTSLSNIEITIFKGGQEVFSGRLKEVKENLDPAQPADVVKINARDGAAVASMKYTDFISLLNHST